MTDARVRISPFGDRCGGWAPSGAAGHDAPAPGAMARRWAFSLAELMIALTILGLGLLFIAAALPVGLEYTRQTVDLGNAKAAGEYALGEIEGRVRTSGNNLYDRQLVNETMVQIYRRLDNIHRPREADPSWQSVPNPRFRLRPVWEPIFKVRPFVMGNIGMSPRAAGEDRTGGELVDNTEAAIQVYLGLPDVQIVWGYLGTMLQPNGTTLFREVDFPVDDRRCLARNPVLPGIARVYPPVEPIHALTVQDFFLNYPQGNLNTFPTYRLRTSEAEEDSYGDIGVLSNDLQFIERRKAVDRRISWTAFYRRISYRPLDKGTGQYFDALYDDVAENPLLYEVIIVVTRRPTALYRYPMQDFPTRTLDDFERPVARRDTPPSPADRVGGDRLCPTPWLVTFASGLTSPPNAWVDPLPQPTGIPPDYYTVTPPIMVDPPPYQNYQDRVLDLLYSQSSTITFRCQEEVGRLVPAGSVVIPALNDQRYLRDEDLLASGVLNGVLPQVVGFTPSCPESLPIYTVIETRPPAPGSGDDLWEVVCENNGYYPWVGGGDARIFPVWIVPPAFAERDAVTNQPIYPRESSVMAVIRRTVTLPEIRSIPR